MFSLIKEIQRKNKIQRHHEMLQESFDYREKRAVLSCLWAIANIDGCFHVEEQEFLHMVADTFNYNHDDPNFCNFSSIDPNLATGVIANFNTFQMEWFIVTSISMVFTNSINIDAKANFLEGLYRRFKVNNHILETTLQKYEVIMKDMGIVPSSINLFN